MTEIPSLEGIWSKFWHLEIPLGICIQKLPRMDKIPIKKNVFCQFWVELQAWLHYFKKNTIWRSFFIFMVPKLSMIVRFLWKKQNDENPFAPKERHGSVWR